MYCLGFPITKDVIVESFMSFVSEQDKELIIDALKEVFLRQTNLWNYLKISRSVHVFQRLMLLISSTKSLNKSSYNAHT